MKKLNKKQLDAVEELVCVLDELDDKPQRIEIAAIKIKDRIFTGKRHCDCFKAIFDAGIEHFGEIQGFLTDTGRFVNRREAREIAVKAKQLLAGASKGNILHSDDIY